jgi:hypothetical protein
MNMTANMGSTIDKLFEENNVNETIQSIQSKEQNLIIHYTKRNMKRRRIIKTAIYTYDVQILNEQSLLISSCYDSSIMWLSVCDNTNICK